ncbi:MAG: winged helix-turn-helix domain-containing protein [Pyrinomonadaceae bacterium]
MSEVLDKVQVKLGGVLKDVDFEPLASDTNILRWRNAAQWARNTLVKERLLKNDSPRGTWEITEAGTKALRET